MLKKSVGDGAVIGIWRMEEPEAFFMQSLDLQVVEHEELAKIIGRRRLEWLASRYLVHEMLMSVGYEDRVPVLKDEFGKPHIWGTPFHLSFSHSHELVAVILANAPTGIDIQKLVPKIEVLAHKFLRPEELGSLQPETRLAHLHFYWGAKEALYKAHGRRQLDFREHIFIQPFDYQPIVTTSGRIEKDGDEWVFDVFFEKMEDYVLVWCL
ncbi:MAG: 4'-phosphopantetheinyl transferase superfamily protein [Saprospiraceae bacterium]|nr:4'-phosphopantetheinyl transferase superfamily protein [Saprospiraceae bacterium]